MRHIAQYERKWVDERAHIDSIALDDSDFKAGDIGEHLEPCVSGDDEDGEGRNSVWWYFLIHASVGSSITGNASISDAAADSSSFFISSASSSSARCVNSR